ncbi:MAG: recombinase family protein [Clostridium sp.]
MAIDKKTNSNKIAIYSRKSKFTGKGESIENQIELCRLYIVSHFPEVSKENILTFEDEGISGGHMDRPEFKQMMKRAERGELKHIVCYRLDRISRNIGDFAKLIEELDTLKIGFISIKEQFDTSSPMGRAMMYIASVFSQLERETIAERIRDNMQELAKTGRWLGGTTPTGYRSEEIQKITVDGKVRKAFKLTIIPEEAQLVKLIYSKFNEMNSLTKVDAFLLQENYMTKNNHKFTRFAIKNILENPVYMMADAESYDYFIKQGIELYAEPNDFDGIHGIMAYNKTIQKRGKAHEYRVTDDWIMAVGKHNGLISGADWIQVQKQLAQNKSKSYKKPRSHTALLSGLLFCGTCGDYMRPKLSSRTNLQGERTYCYLCTMKERSRMNNCSMKNPNGNQLDWLVCNEIKKIPIDPTVFAEKLPEESKRLNQTYIQTDLDLTHLNKNLNEIENEINTLVAALSKAGETASSSYIIKQIENLDVKCRDISYRIEKKKQINTNSMLSDSDFQQIYNDLISFDCVFEHMDLEEKRVVLCSLIKKVVWDGENIHVYF